MDFAKMKRRELQALCKGHGLPAGGTNADLVARLSATLSGCGGVEEAAVGVVVGKGCFKRSAGRDGSDAAKKVSFVLEDEAEVDVAGRRRLRSQGMGSPVAPKKRGRPKKTIPGAGGSGAEPRRTRSQVGAGDGDAGEAVADAPVRRSRRNAADLGAGDGVQRVGRVVTRNSSAKAEHEEEGPGEAVDRKHQRKRKTRENDAEDVDDSGTVGVSRRRTRSSGMLPGPSIVPSPVVEKKRGRRKAGDVKEQTFVKEQSAEVQHVGRTLRSGLVRDVGGDVGPVLPIVAESKLVMATRSSSIHEEDPAAEKVGKVEIFGRTTRSSSAAVAAKLPIVVEKKKRRKTEDVQSNGELHSVPEVPVNNFPVMRVLRNRAVQVNGSVLEDTHSENKLENKRPSTRLGTSSCMNQDLASSVDEETQERVAAPCKGLPQRRSKRNHSEESDSGKVSAIEMQMEVLEPVRRSHRKSVVPSFFEYGTKGMHEEVEKQQTVLKPVKKRKGLTTEMIPKVHVKRPTRKSVVPAMIEKGRKGVTAEMIPEALVRRSIKKSVLPMVNSENNDHGDIIRSGDVQSAKSEEVKKQPVRRLTRKSAVVAVPMKERKSVAAEMNPDAHVIVRRSMRKSVVPNLLNNDDSDQIELQSAKGGAVEKQVVVKEPVGRSTHKSVVPDVLHEKMKSEIPVRRLVGKSITPNASDKEHKDHREMVRREESSVRTRTSQTRLQFAVQNDESLRRTTRNSSKLVISPLQSEPTASKGRPAKRRRTSAVQEFRPVEEHKEKQIADIAKTTDVIEAGTAIDLDSGVLPLPAGERSNLRDEQLNSNFEVTEVVESRPSGDEDADNILEFGSAVNSVDIRNPSNSSLLASSMDLYQQQELPGVLLADKSFEESAMCSKSCDLGAVGATEKSPCDLAIPDGKQADSILKEVLHSMKNDAGRCSPNVEQSPIGLQALFSHGNAEELNTHDAIPCSENEVKEPDVLNVECRVETIVSSGLDSYQGPHEDLSRIEENGGCMLLSQHNNEQEGFSLSSQTKDLVASTLSGLSEDENHIVREIITEDVICNEDEKKDLIPSSDVDAYASHADEPDKLVSGVCEAQFCISQSTPTVTNSSQVESLDASDNHIASPYVSHLAKECLMDPCQEQELKLPDDISLLKSPEGAAVFQDESVIGPGICQTIEQTRTDEISSKDHEEKCNEHSESVAKEDTSNISDTRCFGNKSLSSLKDSDGMPTPKSPEEYAVCLDGSVSGSVAGVCQTSGRRHVEEISTKLPSFKISTTVKGSYIEIDVPHCADQWDNLTEPAIALHRDSENTTVAEIDHVKPSTDHLVAMDSSAQAVQSISVPAKDAEFATDNPDNKPDMEQVQQDVVQVQEGTPEKTVLGSATPECEYECRLPDDAELHSVKNDRCSSSVEQSPCLQSLFWQTTTEVPMEYGALSLARVQADNGVCEAKDCDVECRAKNSPLREPIVDHDAHADFTSQQGLTNSCHEQEQDASGQLEFLEAPNCTQVHEDEENKDRVHSTDMISACETMDANGPIDHASHISDALLSHSPITPTEGNDKVQLSSNQNQLESTDFLDGQIGCCNSEVPQQGLKEQCEEQKEDQVAHGISVSNIIEAETAVDLESGGLPLPAEERSNSLDEQHNIKLVGAKVLESRHGCDKEVGGFCALSPGIRLFANMAVILEPGSVANSVGKRTLSDSSVTKDPSMDHYQQHELSNDFSVEKSPEESATCLENSDPREKCSPNQKQSSSSGPRLLLLQETMEGPDMHYDLELPSADNKNGSNRHIELDVEKNTSSEPDSGQGFHEDSSRVENVGCVYLEVDNEQEGSLNSSRNKEFVTSAQLDSSDDVNNKEIQKFTEEVICKEDDKWEFVPSPDIDTPHEKSHISGPAEHATGVSSPGAHTFAEGNVNSNSGELESHDALGNCVEFSNTEVQVTTGIDASGMTEASAIKRSKNQIMLTSALPDEQLNSELDVDEFAEHNFSGDEHTDGLFGDLFHFHEDDPMESVQGQELPSDKSAPESPEKSAIGQDDSDLGPDIWQTIGLEFEEETNTELHQDCQEESNISEPARVEGLGNGMTTETSLPDGQPNPELEGDESQVHGCSSGPEKNQISVEEYNEHNEDIGNL